MFAHKVVSWTVEQSNCIFCVTIVGFPVHDSAIGNREPYKKAILTNMAFIVNTLYIGRLTAV